MKLGIKTAAVAGGMLTALFAAGCAAHATRAASAAPAGGASQVTVRACAAYGVHAIEHHITVTWTPAPCRGLSKAEVNQAVAMAVVRVAGDGPKAVRRKRAAGAAPYLDHLVTALPPAASSGPARSEPAVASGGRNFAMSVAALIAWLVTAGSGAYVLVSWIARGGSLRRPPGSTNTGSPSAVIFAHFGLALSGLAIWVVYLVTGWSALAWAAVAVLLPVAGLGMTALVIGLPWHRAPAVEGSSPSSTDPASTGREDTQTISVGAAGTQTAILSTRGIRRASVGTRLSPLVIVGHGVLAVTTMLLVLLAALGGVAN